MAIAQGVGERVCDFNLERALDDADGVGLVGFAYAQAIVEEGRIAVRGSDVDVAVVLSEVPVGLIELRDVSICHFSG